MNKIVISALDLLALACLIFLAARSDLFSSRGMFDYFLIFAALISSCYLAFRSFSK